MKQEKICVRETRWGWWGEGWGLVPANFGGGEGKVGETQEGRIKMVLF